MVSPAWDSSSDKALGRLWDSLVVQWVRLRAFTAEGAGSVLGWGTKTP